MLGNTEITFHVFFHFADDSETLAVRWTAVESLKKDEFSTGSDVWMLAMFMYEVLTHGRWPYSELVDMKTDDIMHMVSCLIF